MSSPLLIGVDGGGTKTTASLAPVDDYTNVSILGRGQAGPGNPRSVGFDVAQRNITAAIAAAFANAKLPRATAAAACFGLAGAGREVEQRRIEDWAKNVRIADAVRVCGDAELILASASSVYCGIALISGTGSMAWGRNLAGDHARCGGWGYLLGDEGSAYAIARSGLQAAVRAADGRGQVTSLLPLFQNELRAAAPHDLVERIYSPQMTREQMAGLAHLVVVAAPGDPVAMQILDAAADELAQLVGVMFRRLKFSAGAFTLALAGGVLINETLVREQLLDKLRHSPTPPGDAVTVNDPVRGAVALARALAAS